MILRMVNDGKVLVKGTRAFFEAAVGMISSSVGIGIAPAVVDVHHASAAFVVAAAPTPINFAMP